MIYLRLYKVSLVLIFALGIFLFSVIDNRSFAADPTTTTEVKIGSISCTSTGQTCTPTFAYKFNTTSVFKAKYNVPAGHCSYSKIHFIVDGKEKEVSDWLGWSKAPASDPKFPLSTPEYNLGPLSSGQHTLELRNEGQKGGCNTGKVISWGGSVTVTTSSASSGGTKLSLDLLLHGIGKAGDSVYPGAAGGGNMNPKHKERDVKVGVYNLQDQEVLKKEGKVTFDSTSGSFKGLIDIGTLTTGSYIVKVKMKQSLNTQVAGAPTIIAGATTNIPQTSLITGDINDDNAVSLIQPDITDYSILISCFDSCSEEEKIQADLDDNGEIDQFDYNLFIRELTHLVG